MRKLRLVGGITCSVLLFQIAQTAVGQERATMQFPVERDIGILGWENHDGYGDPPVFDKAFESEEFANHGYMASIRGRKFTQHGAILDWDTDAIKSFIAKNADPNEPIEFTLNIYPRDSPAFDITIETLESKNDWVEGNGGFTDWVGDGNTSDFENLNWEEGTLAATTNFAQTAFKIDGDGDRVLDVENSVPWVDNDEGTGGIDDNQYSLLSNRPDNFSQGNRIPDLINTEPFFGVDLGDAAFNFTFASVELDKEVTDALLNDPDNRGLIFGPVDNAGSNWQFWTREGTGDLVDDGNGNLGPGIILPGDDLTVPGPVAPFLEITFTQIEGVVGDFDSSGVLDLPDVNMLNQAIASGANDETFDLNDDQLVDDGDLGIWVSDLKGTWFGDADLDGEFNTTDLVNVLAAGTYEVDVDASWDQGDWTGDLRFDTGDLVKSLADGGFEAGPKAATAAVPEPSSLVILTVLSLLMTLYRRK